MEKTEAIDVCFSFDTTGSMYPCLTQVRRRLVETGRRLFRDIPDLRISVIAQGDFCDVSSSYATSIFDFSDKAGEVANFVSKVGRTGGGDAPECYELVLFEARTKLSWRSGRSKVIVMIGDDIPHGPNYLDNKPDSWIPPGYTREALRIDWRNELGLLLEAGINVYGIHAMPGTRRHSKQFYQEIASKTGGFYLTLDQFSTITDLIMGICYRQDGDKSFATFAAEVTKGGRMTRNLRGSFMAMVTPVDDMDKLKEAFGVVADEKYTYEEDGLTPVPSGRFMSIEVDTGQRLSHFIEDQGIEFERGRSFYELVEHRLPSGKLKRYKVQQYKEVILMDRRSGDMFTGPEAREALGLLPQIEIVGKDRGEIENIGATSLERYRVFIQSTSYTRQLVPGSCLLYEVSDWDYEEAA